ncbi:uncharacterized protein LOC142357693 [Convolutriloba macropyga]|uniref:uncharacterized protein LOC142357693 n=1 Tax=Convolutriloba macropyga TaxID=536237 RepID=UPI003F51DF2B
MRMMKLLANYDSGTEDEKAVCSALKFYANLCLNDKFLKVVAENCAMEAIKRVEHSSSEVVRLKALKLLVNISSFRNCNYIIEQKIIEQNVNVSDWMSRAIEGDFREKIEKITYLQNNLKY